MSSLRGSVRVFALSTVLTLLAAACATQPSYYLYDVSATAACLRNRPEYVPGRIIPIGKPPNRLATANLELHVFKTYVYPTRITAVSAPDGTRRLNVSFAGPDPVDQQPAEIYFLRGDLAARRLYESEYGPMLALITRHVYIRSVDLEQVLRLSRNVVVLWIRPNAPAHLRTMILDCLKTRR